MTKAVAHQPSVGPLPSTVDELQQDGLMTRRRQSLKALDGVDLEFGNGGVAAVPASNYLGAELRANTERPTRAQ